MSRNNLNDRASTLLLVGIMSCASIAMNSSDMIRKYETIEQHYNGTKVYGNDTQLLEKYSVNENKFTVEEEAEYVFGKMREATVEEQKNLMESIEQISVESGVNFWDYI